MVVATSMPENKEKAIQLDLPVIDLSWRRDAVKKLAVRACEEFGFFKVINHGIPKEIIERVDRKSKEFFALPASEKQKVGPPNPLGYGSKKIGPNGDTGELEYLLFHTNPSSINQRVGMINKKDPKSFSCVANDYVESVRELTCKILEIIGEGLGLYDTKAFSRLIRESESDSLVRMNHYPPYHGINAEKELNCMNNKDDKGYRLGFGEHTDPQILTVLRSNDVEGLQIQSPSDCTSWIPVKSDPSAFFVNVGDALQAMTNGRLVSVRHRAMANTKRSRLSTMFFAAPSLQTSIYPLPEMMTVDNHQRYRPYTWAEYKKTMYSLRLASNCLELFRIDSKGNNSMR